MPDLTLKLAANGFILLIAVTGWGLENRWHDRRTRVRRHWARPDCTHRGRSARGWRSDMAHAQPRRGGTRAQRKDRARRADTGKRAAYETVSHSRRAGLSVVAMAVMAIVVATPALGSDSNAAKPSASAVSDVPQELRVRAWNVLKLGHGYRKNFAAVARAIEGHFDVVAPVEVMQKGGLTLVTTSYEGCSDRTGTEWSPRNQGRTRTREAPSTTPFCSERTGSSSVKDGKGSCITKTTTELREKTRPICLNENPRLHASSRIATGRRRPSTSCLPPTTHGGRWKGGIFKREEVVKNLEGVFRAMGEARPGEKDLIVAGDFNLTPSKMETALGDRPRIAGSGSTLKSSGARTENIYDYVLIHDQDATSEMTEQPIIDVRWVAADHASFRKTVSDHLPVVAEFGTDGHDDDVGGGFGSSGM